MTPVLCVTGYSGSGKTTLIEKLLPELARRGLRVGTLKHDVHGAEPDREGKDTWRMARAGSALVALGGPRCVMTRRDVAADPAPEELARLFAGEVDLVLAEGYSASKLPKIEVCGAGGAPGRNAPRAREGIIATVRAAPALTGVPDFGDGDLEALADHVLRWREQALTREQEADSEAAGLQVVEVQICLDGKALPLKPFLARMLDGIVRGFLASLKWVGEPARIEIRIERRQSGGSDLGTPAT